VRDTHAPAPQAPLRGSMTGPLEGTETLSVWLYDRERTPQILEALDRPTLEVQFMLEPNRRTDALHSPGLVKELREKIARLSIVNPDLIPPAAGSGSAPAAQPAALPRSVLDPAVRSVLEKAPFTARSGESVFGEAVLWREKGIPQTHVWFFLPPAPGKEPRTLHGVIRNEAGGEEVATLSEPVVPSETFAPADPGQVVSRLLELPPGSYEAAFAVTEGSPPRPIASAASKLSVPDLVDGSFAVSSLLLTRGPGTRNPGDSSPFAIGQAVLPPRADATFSAKENLWVFLELANARQPAGVTLEVRLRPGAGAMITRPPFPAQPVTLSPDRSLCGFELPLSELDAGDYRLYVLVRDGGSPADQYVLRSADFRLRP
jgi:hypothetical protein